jgi:hypothetical protein
MAPGGQHVTRIVGGGAELKAFAVILRAFATQEWRTVDSESLHATGKIDRAVRRIVAELHDELAALCGLGEQASQDGARAKPTMQSKRRAKRRPT